MGLLLNILIAVLMLITIGFCWRLSKKITVLNSSKKEMAEFLLSFSESIMRAERNINELKSLGTQVDETLKGELKKARFLANDLSFLTDKGESIAENLDKKINDLKTLGRSNTNSEYQNRNANSITQRGIESSFNPIQARRPVMNNRDNHADTPQSQYMMSPSKKQALETILEEIARRRSVTTNKPEDK